MEGGGDKQVPPIRDGCQLFPKHSFSNMKVTFIH